MTSPAERDEQICQRYINENISAKKLAQDYGLSEVRLRQILSKYGVKAKDRVAPHREIGEVDPPLSALHRKIGLRLVFFRTYTRKLDRPELSQLLGWAVQKTALVERGEFNLTLIDLQDIARALQTTPAAVLDAPEIVAPTDPKTPNPSDQV